LEVDQAGVLYYVGRKLPPSDPLWEAIVEHRDLLIEMMTRAPGGRCVFTDCPRLLAPGDMIACPDHRAEIDATPVPWEWRQAARATT
jgi:hypothetical protein